MARSSSLALGIQDKSSDSYSMSVLSRGTWKELFLQTKFKHVNNLLQIIESNMRNDPYGLFNYWENSKTVIVHVRQTNCLRV